jgi:hypothetical protein
MGRGSGRGWVALDGGEINGMMVFHHGDGSAVQSEEEINV